MRRYPQKEENFIGWMLYEMISLAFCFFATFLITAPIYAIVWTWYFLKESVRAPEQIQDQEPEQIISYGGRGTGRTYSKIITAKIEAKRN